jgi:hypothetical protein
MASLPPYIEPFAGVDAGGEAENLAGREHLLFRVDPRISYVSAQFAGEDAAFWQPQRQ